MQIITNRKLQRGQVWWFHAHNPSSLQAEAESSPVHGQPRLHNKILAQKKRTKQNDRKKVQNEGRGGKEGVRYRGKEGRRE
jgi:hypothetical protein